MPVPKSVPVGASEAATQPTMERLHRVTNHLRPPCEVVAAAAQPADREIPRLSGATATADEIATALGERGAVQIERLVPEELMASVVSELDGQAEFYGAEGSFHRSDTSRNPAKVSPRQDLKVTAPPWRPINRT